MKGTPKQVSSEISFEDIIPSTPCEFEMYQKNWCKLQVYENQYIVRSYIVIKLF